MSFLKELARCNEEIKSMYSQPPVQPAIITTLGITDWERERELILIEQSSLVARDSEKGQTRMEKLAISLWQPWATLWLLSNPDEKVFETRHWKTQYHGELLVHAAKKRDGEVHEFLHSELVKSRLMAHGLRWQDLAFGAVIGKVDLISCDLMADLCDGWSPSEREQSFGNWSTERYAWKRGPDPVLFPTAIPFKGKQGFFNVPEIMLAGIRQTAEART